MCVLLWHIECIPELCSLQRSGACWPLIYLPGLRCWLRWSWLALITKPRWEHMPHWFRADLRVGWKWRLKKCVWGCYWWDWSVSWLMCHFGMIHELRDVWRNDKCSCVHFCAICLHVFTFLFVFVNLWTVWLRVLAHVRMCGGVCECVVWVCLSSCLFK